MIARHIINTPIGKILLEAQQNLLISCRFINASEISSPTSTNTFLQNVQKQIEEYFLGQRKIFNIALAPQGTPFQQSVWKELQKIPYGQTVSYKEIAQKINHPLAYRAVGMANNKNPIAIIIPCHRVIGSNNKLVGYAGGLEIKQKLLQLEQQYK